MPPWTRCSRLPDVLVSLAEGPPGRADLARRRAITLQAGSHTGGPATRSGPLLAIAAGQAARNGLCRPPAWLPGHLKDSTAVGICRRGARLSPVREGRRWVTACDVTQRCLPQALSGAPPHHSNRDAGVAVGIPLRSGALVIDRVPDRGPHR